MPSRAFSSLVMGVSCTGVTLVLLEGWVVKRKHVLFEGSVSPDAIRTPSSELSNLIFQALADHSSLNGLYLRVVIADELLRYFMVTPPANALSWSDCESAALMRFESLYDTPSVNWTLRFCPHAYKPFLACALPAAFIQAIQTASQARGHHLMGLQPFFTWCWNQWVKSSQSKGCKGWIGAGMGETLTIGIVQNNLLTSVFSMPFDFEKPNDWQQTYGQLALEATRFGVQKPQRLDLFIPPTSKTGSIAANFVNISNPGGGEGADSFPVGCRFLSRLDRVEPAQHTASAWLAAVSI